MKVLKILPLAPSARGKEFFIPSRGVRYFIPPLPTVEVRYILPKRFSFVFFFLVFDNGVNGPRIHLKKYHPRIDDEININFEKFDFQTWHHYCFLFTSQAQFPYPGGYVNLTNKAYVDGELVNTGKPYLQIPTQINNRNVILIST